MTPSTFMTRRCASLIRVTVGESMAAYPSARARRAACCSSSPLGWVITTSYESTPTGLADGLGRGGLPALARLAPTSRFPRSVATDRFGVRAHDWSYDRRCQSELIRFCRMLIDALRRRLGDPEAQSFQLFGEDLIALTGGDLAD